jgi:hypothetical protein
MENVSLGIILSSADNNDKVSFLSPGILSYAHSSAEAITEHRSDTPKVIIPFRISAFYFSYAMQIRVFNRYPGDNLNKGANIRFYYFKLLVVYNKFPLSRISRAYTSFRNINQTLLPAGENLEQPGIEIFHGSNNRAVSGRKSKPEPPYHDQDKEL